MKLGRSQRDRFGRVAGLALIAAAVALAPAAAWACINGTILRTDEGAQLVARAERDLAAGRPARALARLRGGPQVSCRERLALDSCGVAGPGLYELGSGDTFVQIDSAPLARRWALLTAIATLRVRHGVAERMARHLLYLQQRFYRDSPLVQARIAEALARVVGAKPQALALLADLERRDLLPDPESRALLARLRFLGVAAPRPGALGPVAAVLERPTAAR